MDSQKRAFARTAPSVVRYTADEDFAQILSYPPAEYAGIVVLWHPRPTLQRLEQLVRQVVIALKSETPVGRLWIVEPGRIRIHEGSRGG